ncbi:pseudouridine synthase [Obelidium mucronatum]|nr:pseudouridine synthase [Obelidium mucronatum]
MNSANETTEEQTLKRSASESVDAETATAPPVSLKKHKTEVKPKFTVEQLLALSGVPADRSYLLETDVGITSFLNPLQTTGRLTAIIKHRFTDFIVNEVDLAGNVLHLTAEDCNAVSSTAVEKKAPFSINSIDEAVWTELKTFFEESEQDAAIVAIKDMLINGPPKFKKKPYVNKRDRNSRDGKKKEEATGQEANAPEEEAEKDPELLTKVFQDKTERVKVYEFFRTHFFEKLATDSRNTQRICVRAFTNRDRTRSLPRPDLSAKGPGEHLSFVLYKENKDTMECLNMLARVTNTPSKSYTFAGTKDKRGVTVQRCSGHKIFQSKLEGVFIAPNVKIGNFKYVKDRVNLGDLLGNRFAITLRDVALATENEGETDIQKILDTSLTSLEKSGFINYYGMQRFGTRNISTHQVGLAMLSQSWSTAVDLIMMPKGDERPEFIEARKLWMEKRDYNEGLKVFPRSCLAERAVLQAMANRGRNDNYFEALQGIPRNLRLMYVHAVQSFIWNHAASERIRLHGSKIVKGDLVAKYNPLAPQNKPASDEAPVNAGDDEAADISAVEEHRQGRMIEVELIETDEQAATKSIEDLVLPLPGHAIKYPTNEIGEFYKTFMAKYGLDPHSMKRQNRETSLQGDYRRVIIKPTNVSWKMMRYDDPQYPLSLTDLDRINGVPEPVSVPDGSRLGVVVEFTLETSSYATMALREILRFDTGAGYQTVLSAASKAETDAERDEKMKE